MTFLWPLALLGLLAIPLLALLERWRRRPRACVWPTLQLWRAVAETTSASRRRVSPLLIYECAAVGLLALAASGPLLSAGGASSLLVILDDGPHMEARLADGRTAQEATLSTLPAGARRVLVNGDLLAAAAAQPGPFVLATYRDGVEGPGYTVVGHAPDGANIGIDAVSVRGDSLWFALATDGEPRTVSVQVGGRRMQVRTGTGVTTPFATSIRIEDGGDNYAPDDACVLRRPRIVVHHDSDSLFLARALQVGIADAAAGTGGGPDAPDLIVRTAGGDVVAGIVHGSDCVVSPGMFDGLVLDGCAWRGARSRPGPGLLSYGGRALAAWLDAKTLFLGLPLDTDWDDQGTLAVLIDRAKRARLPLADGEALVGDAVCSPAPGGGRHPRHNAAVSTPRRRGRGERTRARSDVDRRAPRRFGPGALPACYRARMMILGTRGSTLAMAQSEWVAQRLRDAGHEVRLEVIVTRGDTELDRTIPEIGGKGLFTAELEQALLDGRIHGAVHSLKDLPTETTPGLRIAAIPLREDPRDAVVGKPLRECKRIGTASIRRTALLLARDPELSIVPVRGNIDTRIQRVRDGDFDAVIVAAAGLHRIDRKDVITEYLDILPAPGQGALAIQTTDEGAAAVASLHDAATAGNVAAERSLLAALEGGCSVPVGALAMGNLLLGCVAAPDGSRVLEAQGMGDDPHAVGLDVAQQLRDLGAQEILDGIA